MSVLFQSLRPYKTNVYYYMTTTTTTSTGFRFAWRYIFPAMHWHRLYWTPPTGLHKTFTECRGRNFTRQTSGTEALKAIEYRKKPHYEKKPPRATEPLQSKLPSYCECHDRERQINSSRCICTFLLRVILFLLLSLMGSLPFLASWHKTCFVITSTALLCC